MRKYELFGLSPDQVEYLSERFGDAVHNSNEDKGTMVVDLSDTDSCNMTKDGYFMSPLSNTPDK